MTPQNVQQTFKDAIRTNDLDVMVETLNSADMDVNHRDVTHDMETPLMQLCHSTLDDQCVTQSLLGIIEAKAPDMDVQDAVGRTLAMHACIASRPCLLQYVLTGDVDVSISDRTGKNVFHYGACSGSDVIMELLLQHPHAKEALRVLDFKGYSPLDLARQNKAQSIVKQISQKLGRNAGTDTTKRQPLKPVFKSTMGQPNQPSLRHDGTTSLTSRNSSEPSPPNQSWTNSAVLQEDRCDSSKRDLSEDFENESNSSFSSQLSQEEVDFAPANDSLTFDETFSNDSPRGQPPTPSLDEVVGHSPLHHRQLHKLSPLSTRERMARDISPHSEGKGSTISSTDSAASPRFGDKISVPKALAPVASPRRKQLNLHVPVDLHSQRSTSADALTSKSNTDPTVKSRQPMGEIKRGPRRDTFRPVTLQSPTQGGNLKDLPSRPKMLTPFKNGNNIMNNKMNGVKASELGKLNALISPQQSHKRLLHKRQQDIEFHQQQSQKTAPSGENFPENTNTNASKDTEEDSLFEEEIFLDSSLNSSKGLGGGNGQGQGQGREKQGRRSSLSLPDLRDMTGCLVTSPGSTPISLGEDNKQVSTADHNGFHPIDRSPMEYYSDEDEDDGDEEEEEEDDNDEAVLEDDLSDDCIEDCFDDDGSSYMELVKSKRLHKGKNNDQGQGSQRPLPAINIGVRTPRKGKPILKPS